MSLEKLWPFAEIQFPQLQSGDDTSSCFMKLKSESSGIMLGICLTQAWHTGRHAYSVWHVVKFSGLFHSVYSSDSEYVNWRKYNLPACQVAQSCPLFATLWTAAQQAPLSTGFSRQEDLPQGIFPTQVETRDVAKCPKNHKTAPLHSSNKELLLNCGVGKDS